MDGSFHYMQTLGETLTANLEQLGVEVGTSTRPAPVRTFRYDLPTFGCTFCERVCRVSQEALDDARANFIASYGRTLTDEQVARDFDICLGCALDEHYDEEVVDHATQRRVKARAVVHDGVASLRTLPDDTGELRALIGMLYRHRHDIIITRDGYPMVPQHALERAG